VILNIHKDKSAPTYRSPMGYDLLFGLKINKKYVFDFLTNFFFQSM
jgi:hypothetical protein